MAKAAKTPAPAPEPEPEAAEEDATTLFQELFNAACTVDSKFAPQHPKEDAQKFLARITTAIGEMADAAFDELSGDAQEWYNAAAEALNSKGAVTPPEGYEPPPPAKAAKAAPASKKGPPAPARKPGSVTTAYRKAVLSNPTADLATIRADLEKLGVEIRASTLSTIRSDVLATVAVAKEVGRWKD